MRLTLSVLAFSLLGLLSLHGTAQAQTTLDQNKALAGGSLPGDAPGFPITISQPGSYKLTSNLVVPANTTAIDITVPGVTLDLNGFSVMGPVKCVLGAPGMTLCNAAQNNFGTALIQAVDTTVLRNGIVQGSNGVGIKLTGQAHLLENLTVTATAGAGVLRNGGSGPTTLKSVRVIGSLFDGVQGEYLVIEDSLIHGVNHIAVHTGATTTSIINGSTLTGSGNYGVTTAIIRNTVFSDNVNGWGSGKSLGGNANNGTPF